MLCKSNKKTPCKFDIGNGNVKLYQKNKDICNVTSKKSRKKTCVCCTIAIYRKTRAISWKSKN